MDERALVAAARGGDGESFNRLIAAHQDAAYNVAWRLLGQPGAAMRASEEAFAAAYRALPAYRGEPFKVWLLRFLVRACRRQLAPWRGDMAGPPDRTARQGPEAVAAAIGRLSREERVVLVLADMQRLSYEQVARVTGEPVGTVRGRLARARAQLCGAQRATSSGVPANLQ